MTGEKCPICDKQFDSDNNIVVCPFCGTPHHEHCYKHLGRCKNEDRHADGFQWSSAEHSESNHSSDDSDEISCPTCSQKNQTGTIFCINCGSPIHSNMFGRNPNQPFGSAQGSPFGGFPGNNTMPPQGGGGLFCGAPPFSVHIDPQEEIGGEKAEDIIAFIGPSAPSYIAKFKASEKAKFKISWNWASFFLGPIYHAYRKMWVLSIISFIITAFSLLPTFIDIASSVLVGDLAQNLPNFIKYYMVDANYSVLMSVSTIVRVLLSLFSNRIYQNKVNKAIAKHRKHNESVNSDTSNKDTYSQLSKKGGVSLVGAIIFGVLIFGCIVGYMLYIYSFLG